MSADVEYELSLELDHAIEELTLANEMIDDFHEDLGPYSTVHELIDATYARGYQQGAIDAKMMREEI